MPPPKNLGVVRVKGIKTKEPIVPVKLNPVPLDRFEYMNKLTPVEKHGSIWLKRDDLFMAAGAPGGKARTCWHLAKNARGLITASSRSSPQMNIVARMGAYHKIPVRCHCPEGEDTPEMLEAKYFGADIIQHVAGYNNVIISRANEDAKSRPDWTYIPFGMQTMAAVSMTARQTGNLPSHFERLVVPVGSSMSLLGIMSVMPIKFPILGVVVGADPRRRMSLYHPFWEQRNVELVKAKIEYHKIPEVTEYDGVQLDPHYESKCLPFLREGDLLWVVGIRSSSIVK